MAFAAVFTTAKRALSFQQKRAFIQEILFSFFKWGTLAQKSSGGGHINPIAPPPRFRGPCTGTLIWDEFIVSQRKSISKFFFV
jgi:hypothetical protein